MAINVPAIALARGVNAPDNREVLWEDTSNMNLPFYERIKSYDSNSQQWRMVTQFPLELLNELRKVDGDGSGLDANFLQGRTVNDIIQLAKDGSFTLPSGFIFVGDTLGNATARALSGDATLQPSGSLVLASTGVTAGTYNLASLTIDAKGRITNAVSYTINVNDIPELPQSKITGLVTDLSNRELLVNKENSVIDTSTTKYPTVNLLKIGLDGKQDTLVSGTNIKTLNGDSLLGAGNITTPNTNLGNTNQTIPAATNRTVTLPADSTLAFGNLIKMFGADLLTQILPSAYPSDADIPVGHIAFKLDTGKMLGRYRVDATNYLDVSFGSDLEIFNGTDVTPLTKRSKIRFTDFLGAVDDAIEEETVVSLDANKLVDFNSNDFMILDDQINIALEEGKIKVGNVEGRAVDLTLTDALATLTIDAGVGFKIGVDAKLALNVSNGKYVRGNANNEGVEVDLISGTNKTLATNDVGDLEEVDLVYFFDLLTQTGVTANNILSLLDLSGNASGIKGGWRITDFVIENTTANVVVINVGTTNGNNDVLNAFSVGANFFDAVDLLKTVFSKTVEQDLYVSSSNWNSANLTIKISVKKIF